MKVCSGIEELKNQIKEWKMKGLSIGFVPTMGYLHKGHGSLIEKAVLENDRVVVSIFVNPIQFGESEDLDSYPRDWDKDFSYCKEIGAHLIFSPQASEMYPKNFSTFVDVNQLTKGLCGQSRPGHFRGVCTVVHILFQLVQPDRAYFGQKDAQQLLVIRRMVADLHMPLQIIGCPIVREADGLAMSSRNTYLVENQRVAARILNKSLVETKKMIENGEKNVKELISFIVKYIQSEPLAVVDYVEIVDMELLEPVEKIQGTVLVALAVFIGKTRLIDNLMIEG